VLGVHLLPARQQHRQQQTKHRSSRLRVCLHLLLAARTQPAALRLLLLLLLA
jgi:hypothetical protein